MLSLQIPMAEVTAPGEAVSQNGQMIRYSRVMWMGGDAQVPNPKLISGIVTDLLIEVEIKTAAKVYREKNTTNSTGSLSRELKFRGIISAKAAK